jgi:glycosyltransferase involved in cell wall biosynthesis
MNLLVLGGYLKKTQAGWAHATLGFINEIAKRKDVKVFIFVIDVDKTPLDPAVQVIKYPPPGSIRLFWRFGPLARYFQYIKILRSYNFSHIDICYTQDHIEGLAFRKLNSDIPIISHTGAVLAYREYLEETSQGKSIMTIFNAWLSNRIESRVYKAKSWAHIVSTPIVARTRESHFNLHSDFFYVSPFAVDHFVFNPDAANGDIRNEFNIPGDAIVLISVSRLVPWKNTAMLLSAIARLNRDDVYLIVVGDGREQKSLEAQGERLKISDKCFFTGHISNPAPYLADSDIFVLPSKIESFGIVYAEAMACGLPCIGLRNNPPDILSSAIDVIDEGKCGFCISSEDELVDKLELLISDNALKEKLGRHALKVAQTRYSWPNYVEKFIRITKEKFNVRN